MEAIDLSVPIYLNQQTVFDLLAILEDGFSQVSNLRIVEEESNNKRASVGASLGLNNIVSLFGITLSGEGSSERGVQNQSETTTEKVHTATSLFARLRLQLQERELLVKLEDIDIITHLASGNFVEFKAILRKNPLVDAIETFREVFQIVSLFSSDVQVSQRGKRKGKPDSNQEIMSQMEGMLTALQQTNSLELLAELPSMPSFRAVLSVRPEYFADGTGTDIIDGEFHVLGKVSRVIPQESLETINLLRKTSFGRFNSALFEQMRQGFAQPELQSFFNIPEIVTEIDGPAIQVLPIAIFT